MALNFYRKPSTVSGAGGTSNADMSGVPVLTKAQARTLGRSPDAIAPGFRERNADDPYGKALATYYKQIETEIANYRRQQEQKRVQLSSQLSAAQQAYEQAENALNEQKILMQYPSTSRNARRAPERMIELQAARDRAAQAFNNAKTLSDVHEQNWINDFKKFSTEQRAKYQKAEQTAGALTDRLMKQRGFDADYDKARKEYENAVTQHDKDRAAYEMYQAQKKQYDQDAAQRQADIDAGRYAVNPYLFMAQGASLPEIEQLRKQMNEGNLRPNMRMPEAPQAPKEVKDPGEFNMAMPTRQSAEDVYVPDDVAEVLGYQAPKERKPDAELPTVSTEATDTSSVKSNYTSPETTPDKPTAAEKQVPPTTNTLQQTSSQSAQPTQSTPQSPPQQQPSVATTNPDTTLPKQETGTVSGQQSQSGQQPQQQPQAQEEPKPFQEDQEEKDQVFPGG